MPKTKRIHVHRLKNLALICAFVVNPLLSVAQKRLPEAVIPLGAYRGEQPTVGATVGGRAGLFLFDTGGGITVLSPQMAAASGCKPWGNITGFRMTGERIDIPRCDDVHLSVYRTMFTVPTAGVFDIMAVAGQDAPHVDGSIALDAFAGKELTLDLARHQLTVETKLTFASRIQQARRVPIRIARDAEGLALEVYLGVQTPSGRAWMELDTGNDSSEIVLSKSVASLFGVDPKRKQGQPVKLVIAPGVELDGNARVLDTMIMDGNVGLAFLKRWILMMDLKNANAWVAPVQ